MKKQTKGLVIINTGQGKGKTTAGLGLLLRAWGQGLRPCVIQFVKAGTGRWGEVKAAEKLGVEWHKLGDGFTWKSKDSGEGIAKALHGWEIAKEKIASGEYDLIVLDEFTYTMHFEWLNTNKVIDWLKANKPPELHLVITGRYAPEALIDYADLVTEMTNIKHPFDKGIKGQRGIEF
ncbi:MAG: cob(I)yrinic acid a,c-diamide adenosyltransferase [Anaerolineales bacterium]|nr:cob(I)yrinic acid a,c-diamide adenosyltransferase [Anaerolineales bacterium]